MARFRMRVRYAFKVYRDRRAWLAFKANDYRDRRDARWLNDARRITESVIRPDNRDVLYDPLYEDALGECLVLLMHHRHTSNAYRDRLVREGVEAFVHRERTERWWSGYELMEEIVA